MIKFRNLVYTDTFYYAHHQNHVRKALCRHKQWIFSIRVVANKSKHSKEVQTEKFVHCGRGE